MDAPRPADPRRGAPWTVRQPHAQGRPRGDPPHPQDRPGLRPPGAPAGHRRQALPLPLPAGVGGVGDPHRRAVGPEPDLVLAGQRGRRAGGLRRLGRPVRAHRYYPWFVDRFHLSTQVHQAAAGTPVDLDDVDAALADLGFCVVHCVRRPDTFPAAREARLLVSGNPSQYDDLDVFVAEQEAMAAAVARVPAAVPHARRERRRRACPRRPGRRVAGGRAAARTVRVSDAGAVATGPRWAPRGRPTRSGSPTWPRRRRRRRSARRGCRSPPPGRPRAPRSGRRRGPWTAGGRP